MKGMNLHGLALRAGAIFLALIFLLGALVA